MSLLHACEARQIAGLSQIGETAMSLELILPFLRPMEPLLLERRLGRRVVREVLRLKGYDQSAKQFLFGSVYEVEHATA